LFKDDETRDYVLKVLASCLVGHKQFEELYIFTGSGRNGKGVLDTLIRNTFGELYQCCHMSNFTVAKKSMGEANSALAQAQGKRILMATEPEENEKLLVSRLKQFSGSDVIEARQLFGESFEYQPQFTIFFQCNEIPQLSRLDKAIQNRLRIIDFPFEFTDTPKNKNQKKAIADIKYKYANSEAWRDEFMRILIEIYEKDVKTLIGKTLPSSKDVLIKSSTYFADNNEVKEYIDTNYEFENKDPDNKKHWHKSKAILEYFNAQAETKIDTRKFTAMLRMNDIKVSKKGGFSICLLGKEKIAISEANEYD
jgi:P4 family phage/plasmid primase-like protien